MSSITPAGISEKNCALWDIVPIPPPAVFDQSKLLAFAAKRFHNRVAGDALSDGRGHAGHGFSNEAPRATNAWKYVASKEHDDRHGEQGQYRQRPVDQEESDEYGGRQCDCQHGLGNSVRHEILDRFNIADGA